MTNNTINPNAAIDQNEEVVGMENIPVINEEDITTPGGKKMKVHVKRDMKKLVKPALIFGAGAATCYVGIKVVPMVMAKRAATKAVDVVADVAVDTAIDAVISTAADVIVTTASAAASLL